MLRGLIEPLWLPIIVLAGVWGYLWRLRRLTRWPTIVGTTALCALWLVCTPAVALILERPLVVESALDDEWTPSYIFVLSGGYDIGDLPEGDSCGLETIRRVHRAVLLWREHPAAVLVMAGAQPGMEGLRDPDQQGRLMQVQAERLGVPAANIMIDAVSTNTNTHAKVAKEMSFLTAKTPLAIVTSDFHLRRSRREFSRFFNNVRMVGSDPAITDDSFSDLSVTSFVPRVDALHDSTLYLREYAALLLSDIRN